MKQFNQIIQIKNGGKRDIGLWQKTRKRLCWQKTIENSWKLQRGKITKNVSHNTQKERLDNGTEWIRPNLDICSK